MTFQSSVLAALPAGVPGEIAFEGPLRSVPATLNSSDATQNQFGRACTWQSELVAIVGGTGAFAGILADPKDHVSAGTTAGTLAPQSAIANNSNCELVTMGEFWVPVATAAAIGDLVVYDTTTGALSTVALGTGSAGTGKAFVPNCVVSRFTVTAAGLACIKITD